MDEQRTFLLVINSSGPNLSVARASLRVDLGGYCHEHCRSPLCEGRVRCDPIEYGLIAAIVAVGIIIGLQNLRDGLNTLFNNIDTNVTTSH